ncbi:hypothetical protein OHA98_21940 [Streptomyces sp. NBC_00654]|uniref:hypothetical protein n=1 Tax=Streptomyces sp. NBC_00654 TaxID=2975799 RepID=UPI002259EC3E|nr:hypothetical protein [Streptomyces sp. NBC_00654]MCX4967376.1 hypothetical protein [Streptomyces sp. NBC_00654]
MLTWEGNQIQGAGNIIEQLKKPGLKAVKTQIAATDAQPGTNNGVVLLVLHGPEPQGLRRSPLERRCSRSGTTSMIPWMVDWPSWSRPQKCS